MFIDFTNKGAKQGLPFLFQPVLKSITIFNVFHSQNHIFDLCSVMQNEK